MAVTMASLCCCSIKEDRTECPCFVDVLLYRQSETFFPQNKAWGSVWDDNDAHVKDLVFRPVIGNDGFESLTIRKNPSTTAIVSNYEQTNNRITVPSGQEMVNLYVAHRTADCTGEMALIEISAFEKKYVNVTFQLKEEAMEYKDIITVTIDAPYNGLSIPSLSPHQGNFGCASGFGDEGVITLRIPPQGGPGMKLGVRCGNNPPIIVDLYRLMLEAGFEWKNENLDDFKTELGLNTITELIEIQDWEIIEIENIRY